ncbi:MULTISPECIES: copper resistance protein B [unclassified Bradyrhizobium]|nr:MULTISPECIES: copper resistance protein B [unclassified Bradyrhizobium]
MNMPASQPNAAKPQKKPGDRRAPAAAKKSPASQSAQDMSMPGMQMPGMKPAGGKTAPAAAPIPYSPPPPPPAYHAADYYYDPAQMAEARRELRQEQGGGIYSKVFFNIAEFQLGQPGGYRWDGQAWLGGDINRFVVKSQGDGSRREGLDSAEVQLLYSRAVAPYTDLQAGIRYDFKPDPTRAYLTFGVQQLFPYWFEFDGALFVSNRGELLGRLEGSYDLLLTQQLVLQPRAELNFAAQNSQDIGVGAGLSNSELGLRLRYEFRREFAPYIGISYDQKLGNTAEYAKASGKDSGSTKFVVGLRSWF